MSVSLLQSVGDTDNIASALFLQAVMVTYSVLCRTQNIKWIIDRKSSLSDLPLIYKNEDTLKVFFNVYALCSIR